jgi:hypothetical protein
MAGSSDIGQVWFTRKVMARRGNHDFQQIPSSHFSQQDFRRRKADQGRGVKGESRTSEFLPFAPLFSTPA